MDVKVLPKYLNWKCIDNFDKVQNKKIFLVGETNITPFMRAKLANVFQEMKEKWTQKAQAIFREEEKTHLEIAGGNYTFFFILPHAIKWIRNRHRFLPVSINLFELGGSIGLHDQSADIIITGRSDLLSREIMSQDGYVANRQTSSDAMFLAASKESIEFFGNKLNTLLKHDILFRRDYANSQVELVPLYSAAPQGREDERPRVVVDQYFLKYLLMRNSVGIGEIYCSMSYEDSIDCLIDAPVARYERFCIIKRDLPVRYRWLSRRLINVLRSGG